MKIKMKGAIMEYYKNYLRAVIVIVIVLCIIGALAGCVSGTTTSNVKQYKFERVSMALGVTRFVDTELNNVCYIYRSSGIHCLPLRDTNGN